MSQAQLEHEIATVGPEMAKQWLQSARIKSKPDRRILESYKRDMRAGMWKFNGEPLVFSGDGQLLDGSHRLVACAETGCEFTTLIVRGVDPGNFVTIDALRRRTASDIMHIRGEPHGRATAAALTFLYRAGVDDIDKQYKKISAPELIEMLDKNSSVRRSIAIAKGATPALPHGLGAGLHYLFWNEDRGLADRFFGEFSGDIEPVSSAVFALKRALQNILDEGGRRSPVVTSALAFKSWAAYREGREIKLLRFSPETEDFPDVPGLDGLELPSTAFGADGERGSSTTSEGRQDRVDNIDVAVRLITPADAEEILNKNDKNRQIAKGIVDKYVRDMEAGNWALNGQTIKIGKTGRLLDGQHRLSACVKSGKSFHAIVVKGLNDEVFDTFDVGNKRSLAQILSDMGESNTALLAASVRQLWQLENRLVQARTVTPSVNEILDTLEKHPDLRKSVSGGNSYRKLGSPSQLVALNYCFIRASEARANEFNERLIHGDELKRGSPILALRDALIEDRNNPKSRMPPAERIAITIKAWNAFWEGAEIKWLRWSNSREAFPQIKGNVFEEGSYASAA